MSRAVLAGIVVLMGVGSAQAHPNTRGLDRMLRDPASGRPVLLLWECGDGLFAVDPCKLLLHDERGGVLGTTEMARITSWACWSESDCVAFTFDSWLPVVPEEAWRIHGRSMWRASNWWRPVGTLVHLWEARFLYLPMLGMFFLPVVAVRRELLAEPGLLNVLGLALAIIGGGVFLIVWLYLVVLQMPLSLPLLLVLLAVCVAVGSQLGSRHEGGSTAGNAIQTTAGTPARWVHALVGAASLGAMLFARVVWTTTLVEHSWREIATRITGIAAGGLFLAAVVLAVDAQKRGFATRALLAGVSAVLGFGTIINAGIAVVTLSCTPFAARRVRHVLVSLFLPLGGAAVDAAVFLLSAPFHGR